MPTAPMSNSRRPPSRRWTCQADAGRCRGGGVLDGADAVVHGRQRCRQMGGQVRYCARPAVHARQRRHTGGSAFQAAWRFIASGQLPLRAGGTGADRVAETPRTHVLNLIWDLLRAGLRAQHRDHDGTGRPTLHALLRRHQGAVRPRVVVRARRNAAAIRTRVCASRDGGGGDRQPARRLGRKRFDVSPRSSGAAAAVLCAGGMVARTRWRRPPGAWAERHLAQRRFMGDRMTYWSDTEFADHVAPSSITPPAPRQAGIVDPARSVQGGSTDPLQLLPVPATEVARLLPARRGGGDQRRGRFRPWRRRRGGQSVPGGALCTKPMA